MVASTTSRWMLLHTLSNRFEADLLVDALKKEGILTYVRIFEETAYDGLFVPQKGWGQILVPSDQLTEARAVIGPLLETLDRPSLYEDLAELDPILWDLLTQKDPEDLVRRTGVSWHPEEQAFLVPFLNGSYRCRPRDRQIDIVKPLPSTTVDFQLGLVILHYLLEARDLPLEGHWIGEKEIPGGHQFFRGPHAFPTPWVLKTLADQLERFHAACQALGGEPMDAGDAGYRLEVFPRIPLLVIYWVGNVEFDGALHVRFDTTVDKHLQSLDTIWAMVNVVFRNLQKAALL